MILLPPWKRIECFPLFLDLNRRIKNHSYEERNSRKYRFFQFHFPGNAGDSLARQSGYPFSTKGRDNDISKNNCAARFKGAWWYESCHHSNLNGLYRRGSHSSFADGVNWYHWKDITTPLNELKWNSSESTSKQANSGCQCLYLLDSQLSFK